MTLMTLIRHPRTQVPRSPPQGNPRQFVAKNDNIHPSGS